MYCKKKSAASCLFCGMKIPNDKTYCSKICRNNYLEYNRILISKRFVKNIIFFVYDEEMKIDMIKKYAKRHQFDTILSFKKILTVARSLKISKNRIEDFSNTISNYFYTQRKEKDNNHDN